MGPVALRKESVDRNRLSRHLVGVYFVALRKESVDRNAAGSWQHGMNPSSLSARRAWIEMDWASVITAMTSRRSPQGERG